MVDFTKMLASQRVEKILDPIKLYDSLDRAHDKGPLRPSQISVLETWRDERKASRDVILKLHTGQGKTLVGLLMLQAKLNEDQKPVAYLCPNNFLIEQTCEQAKQFGIQVCRTDGELPNDFLNGQKILITSVQKLFNGLTKFGLNRDSKEIGTLLMDDAHACTDAIRDSCKMHIPKADAAYLELRTLFATELEQQGVGTYAEIETGKRDARLPVPYWIWHDLESDVAKILAAGAAAKRTSMVFAWPLIKNMLKYCQCIISGDAIEIEPHIAPLESFGSYWKASHRIFMSATVTDDAFLIKGLQLEVRTITEPIIYHQEKWSGEKMVLIPSEIDESLDREAMVHKFAVPDLSRKYGVVALTSAFERSKDWEQYQSNIANKDTVWGLVGSLRKGEYSKTLVLVNRYDGIDLPDDACRVLVFDGKPFSEDLSDSYEESCRPNSDSTLMRTIRTIEQGMGRSVRGEKDYSVIIVLGTELVRLLRDKYSRTYLSSQMATQIEIGLQVNQMAKAEIESGKDPFDALSGLIGQTLTRDPGWKQFYANEMSGVISKQANHVLLGVYSQELKAEQQFMQGSHQAAIQTLQSMLDANPNFNNDDRGWYLQSMARYSYPENRAEFQRYQQNAHNMNHSLMKPSEGMTITPLTIISQGRVERIASWMKSQGDYQQLNIALTGILGNLNFGVKADKFERALNELSKVLGFAGERPDNDWKEGPDNLWALDDTNYIVWECKNEVLLDRSEINKRETEQMNRHIAWFKKHYPNSKAFLIEVHPANLVQSAANFLAEVHVMRVNELKRFTKAVRGFFKSFEASNFADLSIPHIQNTLNHHALDVANILSGGFTVVSKNLK
jgi:replicative superfamily II helicase